MSPTSVRRARGGLALAVAATMGLTLAACSSSGGAAASSGTGGSPAAAGSGGTSAGGNVTTLRLVYDFPTIDFEAIPFVVGNAQGFYKKHGLNVSIVLPPDTSTTVKMLARNKGDIGFDTTADVAFARAAGIPITSIGNYSQENNWGLAAKPGTKIDITKIKGKSFGVFTDSWTKSMMPYVLKAGHVSAGDVKQIIFNSNDLTPMLSGKIDYATNTSNYAIASIKSSTGKAPAFLSAAQFGAPDIPIWVYTASDDWLSSHSAQAKQFLAATQEATNWAIAHPEKAVKEFITAYPNNGQSAEYNKYGWAATVPLLKNKQGKMLVQTASEWSQVTNALKGSGLLHTTLPAAKYYSNAYLPG